MRVHPRKLTSVLFLFLTTAGCAWVWFSREDPATTQNSSFRLLSSQPLDNFACTYPQSADFSGSLLAASLSSFSFSPLLQEANLPVGGTPAGGGMAPLRTIRDAYSTFVSVAVDPVNGEVVVPSPFAQALLIFRGDAEGEEAPLRIIQGPNTLLGDDAVAVDPQNGEIYAVRQDAVLVFPREGKGHDRGPPQPNLAPPRGYL